MPKESLFAVDAFLLRTGKFYRSAGRDLQVCGEWNSINPMSTFPFHIQSTTENEKPLKNLVENSKLEIAVVLNNLFKNMPKVTKAPISIVNLKKITDICNVPMAIKNHQDVNDLLNIMLRIQ